MTQRVKTTLQLDSGLLIQNGAGAGKVLTSDASGNATWAALGASAPSGGGRLYSGVGPPQAVAGVAGDYWLDTAAGILYGPKGSNADSPLNLHTNPSVETNINGYTITASVPAGAGLSERTQAWAVHGSWSHHSVIVRDAVTNCSINTNGAGTSGIVVKPSTAYSVQLHHHLRNTPAFTAGGVTLRIAWYKSDGSASTILAQTGALDYVNGVAGDVLVLRGLNSISPADAAFARLLMYSPQNPGTWDADTDAVIFVEGATLPTEWPATGVKLTASGPAGGDLSGTYPNPRVVKAVGDFAVNGFLDTFGIALPDTGGINFGSDVQFYRAEAMHMFLNSWLTIERALASQAALHVKVEGEAGPRLSIGADGKLVWSDPLVNLYQAGSGELKTDRNFTALGLNATSLSLTPDGTLVIPASAAAGKVLTSDVNGVATWQNPVGGGGGAPSGNAGGDLSGTYPDPIVVKAAGDFDVIGFLNARGGAEVLGGFQCDNDVVVYDGGSFQVSGGGGLRINSGGKITFDGDTNLYRDPAGNKLKTDDSLDVGGILRATSSLIQIPPPLVSVLPSNAVNGQEVYFQDSQLAALNVVWHMRFRGPSPNRWEFVGGGEWATADYPNRTGFNTATLTTFVDLGTSGTTPTPFTAPFSGNYQFGGVIVVTTTTTGQFRANAAIAGSVATGNNVQAGGSPGTWTIPYWGQASVNAGQTVTLFGATNNIAANVAPLRTRLTVQPIYASAMP